MLEKQIRQLKKGDRKAQKRLYEEYSSRMFGLCRRYIRNEHDAEDVMIKGFFKIMTKIDQFKFDGSFEAWMRRIMITESLMFLRKNKKLVGTLEMTEVKDQFQDRDIFGQLRMQEIFAYINQLPDGYRTVLNLYCIEGYKHREIADLLNISINTSKSQLILARKKLMSIIQSSEKTAKRNEREKLG